VVGGHTFLNVEKWGVRGSNPCPYINYAMFLPTELSSRGRNAFYFNRTINGVKLKREVSVYFENFKGVNVYYKIRGGVSVI